MAGFQKLMGYRPRGEFHDDKKSFLGVAMSRNPILPKCHSHTNHVVVGSHSRTVATLAISRDSHNSLGYHGFSPATRFHYPEENQEILIREQPTKSPDSFGAFSNLFSNTFPFHPYLHPFHHRGRE